jgi:WXXGXW repeat (2 copies)
MNKRFFSPAIAGAILALGMALSADAAVFVRVAPPRPMVERVVPAPGRGYVWVGGYYRWSGRAYAWVPGAWVYPPRPAAVWVAPRWEFVPAKGSYVFVAGYWR